MSNTENSVSTVSALKTKEAAARISVSPKTLRDLVHRGLIKPNRKTRHLLFPIVELERFLQS